MYEERAFDPDYYLIASQGPLEWRRDLPEAIEASPTPDELYARDGRIVTRHDVLPSGGVSINRMPIVEGYDWDEVAAQEHGLHSLQAVVNTRGRNYGIATAVVNERQVTYITALGVEAQTGSLVGIVDNAAEDGASFTVFDTDGTEAEAMFTVRRSPDGCTGVRNDSMKSLRVGIGERIPDEPTGRFSFKNIFNGLKRAFRTDRPNPDRNILSGKMSWMAPACTVADTARWMQRQGYDWAATQPIADTAAV